MEERYGAEQYLLEAAAEQERVAYNEALVQWERERDLIYALWPLEDKAAFSAQYGDGSTVLPEADAISQAEAEALARETLKNRYNITDAELNGWKTGVNYRKEGEGTFRWYVTFHDDKSNYIASVTLDAFTGKVIASDDPNAISNG